METEPLTDAELILLAEGALLELDQPAQLLPRRRKLAQPRIHHVIRERQI